MSKLFHAEAVFLDRIRLGERNVRTLVARDVNVMQWLQSDADNPLSNVYLEVEFLNTDSLIESTIGDVFISKVQRSGHQKVLQQIESQFNNWCLEQRFSLLTCAELIGSGCILRPDIIIYKSAETHKTPFIIIDVEIQNRTPSDLHDRVLRYFNCFPSLGAVIEINFFDRRRFIDVEYDSPGHSALAISYRRDHSGLVMIDDCVDFGSLPIDGETMADLPCDHMRLLEPRPDKNSFPENCPWSTEESSLIRINETVFASETKQVDLEPFSIDLWKLLSLVESSPPIFIVEAQ